MDSNRFDALTRALSSRRAAISSGLGGLASLLGLAGPGKTAAHNPMAACRRIGNPGKRRACRRRARAHNRTHRCKPQPVEVTCASRCGSTHDNCGKAVDCPCPAGTACQSNHTCSRTCIVPGIPGDCPAGCACGVASTEDRTVLHCAALVTCFQSPQVCTSTDQCPMGQICVPNVCSDPGRCVAVCVT